MATATQSLCEAANALVQGEGEEEQLIAAAKQVSRSTGQLFLAFKVKADANSEAMEGLRAASNAIRKATDELVRVATDSIKKEPVSIKIKSDIFKEVRRSSLYSVNQSHVNSVEDRGGGKCAEDTEGVGRG